jgi:hypothetical protein
VKNFLGFSVILRIVLKLLLAAGQRLQLREFHPAEFLDLISGHRF